MGAPDLGPRMKSSSSTKVLILYFAFLLLIGLLVREIPNQPSVLIPIAELKTEVGTVKLTDSQSFALGATDIYEHGWVTDENYWLLRLWPPGFMALEGILLKAFGPTSPFILILITLAAALFTFTLLLLKRYLRYYISPVAATLLPLVIFLFPVSRLFLLQPLGVILGETFAIGFYLSGLLLCLLSCAKKSSVKPVVAGLLFALSAYFRSQFAILITFMTAGSALLVLWYVVSVAKKNQERKNELKSAIRTVAISMFVCHLLMFPWRLHNLNDPYVAKLNWVSTESLTYRNAGQTSEDLIANGGAWVAYGGGNLACRLDPTYCGKADKKLYYQVFFQNIGPWVIAKFSLIQEYWFSSLHNFVAPDKYGKSENVSDITDNVFNFILMLFFIATWPLLWWIRKRPGVVLIYWACLTFYACFLVIFTFVQFEVRYFYMPKIFSVFITLIIGVNAFRERDARVSTTTEK